MEAVLASPDGEALGPEVRAAHGPHREARPRRRNESRRRTSTPLRAAGVSEDAIEDAAFVCALFTTYVRLADTFEFDIPPAEGFEQGAKMLLKQGYGFPPPIAWLARGDG